MTDYTELVKALRYTAIAISKGRLEVLRAKTLTAAAAAIEELQQIADHHEQTAKDYWKEACEYKAQLPKRGEWQKAKPKGVVTYSDGYAECSHCHEAIWLGWGMNFCPHCGTQNKIIDPDDYDGAKMEVQAIKSVTMREGDTDTDGFMRKAVETVMEVQE